MAMNNGFNREVRFEIMEHIGVISTYSTGWKKELNLVSWNGGQPKYDIRDWDIEHEHMSRGITLRENEMRQILELMKKRRMENRFRRDRKDRENGEKTEMSTSAEPEISASAGDINGLEADSAFSSENIVDDESLGTEVPAH